LGEKVGGKFLPKDEKMEESSKEDSSSLTLKFFTLSFLLKSFLPLLLNSFFGKFSVLKEIEND
jgi:hypothetical protein